MTTLVLRHRFVAALVICLSGATLLPFVSLSTGSFGWQALADAYIFASAFEGDGGGSNWSAFYPPLQMQFSPVNDPEQFTSSYQIDAAIAKVLTEEPVDILMGVGPGQTPIFAVQARMTADEYQIRARAIEDDGAWSYSAWHGLSELSTPLEVEWTRALPSTRDGSLYLSQHSDLIAWIVDLDNDQSAAVETGIREFSGQPILRQTLAAQ